MAGLDVYSGAYRVLHESFGDRLAASARQARVAWAIGAKTGYGFVIRNAAQAKVMAIRRDKTYVALARLIGEAEPDDTSSVP